MAQIAIKSFGGVAPKLDPVRLPDYAAQTALNCNLDNGTLRPLAGTSVTATPTKVGTKVTIYRFGQNGSDESLHWFHWLDDVDVVRGQIVGDTEERTYYTGDSTFGHPRVTKSSIALIGGTNYPMQSYRLGIPAPTSSFAPGSTPPSGSVSGVGSGTVETRAYVYTWVSVDGEEGSPSTPLEIDAQDGQTVSLTNLSVSPGGYNINRKRIYRTITGFSSGTDYQFVAEITDAITTYVDTKKNEELGETISTIDFDMPPVDLRGLRNLPNGMTAGFVGNDVLYCEPYRQYAWPVKYRQALDFPIVGLAAYGDTLVALTRGNPYLLFGSDPNAIVAKKLDLQESCVSKRSIVEMGWGVMWASPNGLCQAGAQGTGLMTEGLIDKKGWALLNPQSIHAYSYDGKYVGFYDNGTPGCFVFDPQSDTQPFSYVNLSATAGYLDVVRDSLFLQVGANIVKFDSSTNLTYTWRSKRFETPRRLNFGFGKVEAKAFPVTLNVYAVDHEPTSGTYKQMVLRHTRSVADQRPFRLPSGFVSDQWEVELSGTNTVTAVYLAQSAQELGAS